MFLRNSEFPFCKQVIHMLQEMARLVNQRLERLDFPTLYPSFHRYAFALYDRHHICLNGQLLPVNDAFRGNTALLCEGEYIAIWDMASDPVDDPDVLTGCIVHEMLHCHQHVLGTADWPDDLSLLARPASIDCDALRAEEHRLLHEALKGGRPEPFREFLRVRARRRLTAPLLTREEEKVETLEGAAEFTGLRALAALNTDRYNEALANVLAWLSADDERFFDRRRMACFTGTAARLCLARHGLPLDCLPDEPPADSPIPPLPHALRTAQGTLNTARQQRMTAMLRDTHTVPCRARLTGYDPMNMFRVGDRLVCEHFAVLEGESGAIPLMHPVVLTLAPGSVNEVAAYHIK